MTSKFDDERAEIDPRITEAIRAEVKAAQDAAEDRLVAGIYGRVAHGIAQHHRDTGIELKPGYFKVFVGQELYAALMVYGRRQRDSRRERDGVWAAALDITANGNRLGGFDILPDSKLTGDQIRIRAELIV